MTPVERLLAKLPDAKPAGAGWSARCPAHDDRKASLSVAEGEDGRALLKCHAGCDFAAVLAEVGLTARDLMPDRPAPSQTPRRALSPKPSGRTLPTANAAVADLERRHGPRAAAWVYTDAAGEPVGLVVRWNLAGGGKDIRPVARHPDGWRVGAMPDPRPLYRLPDLAEADRVLVCEGEPAADAARSLGFVATTAAGGAQAAGKTDWSPLAGKDVWVLPDNDPPGRQYAAVVAGTLAALSPPATVKVIDLPGLPGKGDLVDWVAAHGDAAEPDALRAELEALAAAANPAPNGSATPPAGGGSDGPTPAVITIDTDEYRVNAEAAAALAREPDLFQRAGMLVQVVEHRADPDGPAEAVRRPDGAPVVRDVPPPLLRERLTRCATWVEKNSRGEPKPAHPPGWCVSAVHARGDWPAVRRLEAVVTHPAVLGDGTILSAAGYDPRSGLLVALPPGLAVPVPDAPTRADVAAAVAALDDVLADFPFETPAHRAAWLAGLLTPLAWFAFDGPAPLFLIDANVRGAGKGLLADLVALTVTGRRFPTMSYTDDREELRKKVTSLAAEGERLVLLDNLAGAVGNDVLDAALTSTRWKDRLLGGNRVYDGPLHVCWYATGNNVQLHADTARRVCHARMETPEERPELRGGFRHPDLRGHVREHRGRLLAAGLTLLRGWFAAGRPRHGLPAWGSFEGWSGVVREAVVFAGLPDPGDTRLALQTAADRDAGAMGVLLRALEQMDAEGRGLTTAAIIDALKAPPAAGAAWHGELRAAVEDLCGRLCGRTLGYKFRHFQRRTFDGRLLDKGDPAHGSNRWVVRSVAPRP